MARTQAEQAKDEERMSRIAHLRIDGTAEIEAAIARVAEIAELTHHTQED